jgi:septal ring factor EnvC (AmiA/AmiB activator)
MEREAQYREQREAMERRLREVMERTPQQAAEERQQREAALAATEAAWGRGRMRWQWGCRTHRRVASRLGFR